MELWSVLAKEQKETVADEANAGYQREAVNNALFHSVQSAFRHEPECPPTLGHTENCEIGPGG